MPQNKITRTIVTSCFLNCIFNRYSVNTRAEAVPGSDEGTIVSTLSVTIRTADEGGRYGCNATNSQGSHAHQARLNVYGRSYILRHLFLYGMAVMRG